MSASLKDSSYEQLSSQIGDIRKRLQKCLKSLSKYFINRSEVIELMGICAIAQEPLLLVGEPGTAKSDLVTKFRDALGVSEDDYFEYMLTKFTEPSEVMGPVDIVQMREGRFVRNVSGKLPTAKIVFLDEVFKSNSAILNTLLTVLNERKFYQNGKPEPVELKILLAASNEIPELEELNALKDRFSVKVLTHSVQDDYFESLIDSGLAAMTQKELNQRPWMENHATLEDILKANRYLTLQMSQRETDSSGSELKDRDRYFPTEVLEEFRRVIKTLRMEDKIFISDRKIVKLYKLLRARAWLLHGGRVEKEDLILLSHLGESKEELYKLEEKVPNLLGLS